MKKIFNLLALCIVAFAINSQAQIFNENEYVDDNTVLPLTFTVGDMRMHTCPTGFMSGFHERKNDLLCLHKYNGLTHYAAMDDYSTMRLGMHACAPGSAMVGIHVRNNVLKCASTGPQYIGWPSSSKIDTNSEFVSYGGAGTLRYGMHACPEGWVMTGVHVIGNRFLCSFVGN
jgi:hypothetical protein